MKELEIELKTLSGWNRFLRYNGVSIIWFTMEICPPCGKIEPHLEELEKEYARSDAPVHFAVIDINAIPDKSREYKVSAAPALFFFIAGEESGERITG